MAPEIVEDRGVCSINTARYFIAPGPADVNNPTGRPGRVTTQIASRYPPKLVTGDTNKDSDPTRSSITYSDMRGGIGVETQRDQSDVNRCFHSDLNLRGDTHLVLRAEVTNTATATAAAVGFVNELASEIYAAFGTAVHKYDNSGDSWGSSLRTLAAAATDSITIRLNGTVYLIIAQTSDWDYTSDGAAYTRVTDDAKYLADFDDKLWTIDNTGQARSYSDVTAIAVTGPQLPLPNGSVKGWVKGRDADGNQILIASTDVGLWALDVGNKKFERIEPEFPANANNGKGVARWRDAVYYSAGESVLKFNQGSRTAVIQPMGLDRDHGLRTANQGPITDMVGTHNELVVANDGGSSDGFIYGWDTLGWQVLANSSAGVPGSLHPSTAYSTYRLWWAEGQRVRYIPLQDSLTNPDQVGSPPIYRASASNHIYPWFDAGQSDVEKLALRIRAEVREIGANGFGNVSIFYATDFGSDTALTAITTAGETTFELPSAATPNGVLFRFIRLTAQMTRGSGTTSTPNLRHLTLEYRKKLPEKLGFRVQLDLTRESPDGKTPQEQLADLVTARNSSTLIEFTFRSDDTSGNPRNYYLDIQDASSQEDTGLDEAGIVTLALVEP